jgi:hypothetical protein
MYDTVKYSIFVTVKRAEIGKIAIVFNSYSGGHWQFKETQNSTEIDVL